MFSKSAIYGNALELYLRPGSELLIPGSNVVSHRRNRRKLSEVLKNHENPGRRVEDC